MAVRLADRITVCIYLCLESSFDVILLVRHLSITSVGRPLATSIHGVAKILTISRA